MQTNNLLGIPSSLCRTSETDEVEVIHWASMENAVMILMPTGVTRIIRVQMNVHAK
jgi:hypothetical protein